MLWAFPAKLALDLLRAQLVKGVGFSLVYTNTLVWDQSGDSKGVPERGRLWDAAVSSECLPSLSRKRRPEEEGWSRLPLSGTTQWSV